MAELQIPPSINDSRSQALMTLVRRLGEIDLTPLLVYRVDSVPAGALPFLAWQFDILSPLWQTVAPVIMSVDAITNVDLLIDIDTLTEASSVEAVEESVTIAAQRALIKMAIQLHPYRGTPWSVKSALATLGWASVSILEGQNSWGSTKYPTSEGWAVFRVMIELQPGQSIDPSAPDIATAAINFFKPARSLLNSLFFVLPAVEDIAPKPVDSLTLGGIATYELDVGPAPSDGAFSIAVIRPPLHDSYGPAMPLYSAHYRHSGITYGANEPAVADSALIVNGKAVLQGG
jgi:P2-related tail formation protein